MIDGKYLFDQTVNNNKVTYENIRKIATGQRHWLFVRLYLLLQLLKNDCSRFKQKTSARC